MDSRQFMNKCAYWFAKGEKAVWHNYFWKGPTLLHDLKAILNDHHLHFLVEDPNDSPGNNNYENVGNGIGVYCFHGRQYA